MGIASRSTKPNGSTAWDTGDTLFKAPLNGDVDNILTQLNGNIDDSNVKSSAAIAAYNSGNEKVTDIRNTCIAAAGTADIAPGKLDQTAGARDDSAGLGTEVVQAYAEDAAEYNTQASPGDSDTPSYPEHLKEELERIRYVIQRLALGIDCKLIDATNAATWFDGCAIGENVLQNGSFLDDSASGAAPFGWDLVSTPNAIDVATLPEQEGLGQYINVVDAAGTGGAANEGFDQTLTGLKGETIYLVEARVLPTTDVVKLVTTGATAASAYDDLDLDSSSGSGDWETLAGIIITDNASPTTAVEVQLLSDAATYDFGVAWVSVREVASTANAATNEHQGTSTRGGQMVRFVQDLASVTWGNMATATVMSVVVPNDGYVVEIDGIASITGNGSAVEIWEEKDAGGANLVARSYRTEDSGASLSAVPVAYVQAAPAPGSVYAYYLTGVNGTPSVDAASKKGHTLKIRLTKV